MKRSDIDYNDESKPLLKNIGAEESDITQRTCFICGKLVRHIKNKPVAHQCVKLKKEN